MRQSIATTDELLNTALRVHDQGDLPRPFCDSPWHTQKHTGDPCPDCLSTWWATDGSEPSEPAMYWLQILARRRV